jgi:hypothetical protein
MKVRIQYREDRLIASRAEKRNEGIRITRTLILSKYLFEKLSCQDDGKHAKLTYIENNSSISLG